MPVVKDTLPRKLDYTIIASGMAAGTMPFVAACMVCDQGTHRIGHSSKQQLYCDSCNTVVREYRDSTAGAAIFQASGDRFGLVTQKDQPGAFWLHSFLRENGGLVDRSRPLPAHYWGAAIKQAIKFRDNPGFR